MDYTLIDNKMMSKPLTCKLSFQYFMTSFYGVEEYRPEKTAINLLNRLY